MKIKLDFVTNSSSTSYIILSKASYTKNGKETIHEKLGFDLTTLEMIKIIEGMLQYDSNLNKINERVKIHYTQIVDEIIGDGWNGGDYNFCGKGYIFFGKSDILNDVMTKDKTLTYTNKQLSFPKKWVKECDVNVIKKKYRNMIIN